jgi:hypothetical protein
VSQLLLHLLRPSTELLTRLAAAKREVKSHIKP